MYAMNLGNIQVKLIVAKSSSYRYLQTSVSLFRTSHSNILLARFCFYIPTRPRKIEMSPLLFYFIFADAKVIKEFYGSPELETGKAEVAKLIKPELYEYPFENLCLEGGGCKGVAYAGVLKVSG